MKISIKNVFGYLIVLIPALLTVLIWIFLEPLAERFMDTSAILLSAGRIFGLVGISLFSTSLFLHFRIKPLTRLFSEDSIERAHHNISSWAFIFILFHPTLLVVRYSFISVALAADYLLPFNNTPVLYGLLGLIILSFVFIATYYLTKHRFLWIWSHRLTLVALVLSVLHMILTTSDVSRYPILKYYVLALMVLSVLAFIYQRIVFELEKRTRGKVK